MSESTKELSGRELDAAIAERVMEMIACDKWRHVNFGSGGGPAMINEGCDHNGKCFPAETGPSHYNESIEAAMQVVEKMRERGWGFDIYIFPETYNVSAYNSGTSDDIKERYLSNVSTRTEDYSCQSFAKALCLAALEASGVDAADLFDLNEGNAALAAIGSKE